MGENPSELKGEDRPVGQVTWADVTSFCEKLTEQESEADRLPAGMSYQLPTEAQWEYACRAETTTAYAFGDSLTSDQANIDGGPDETTDVGKYPPNAWDFHDMHGNVDEWCADWYGENYPTGNVTNPTGPAVGSAASGAVVPGTSRRTTPVPRIGAGSCPPSAATSWASASVSDHQQARRSLKYKRRRVSRYP